MGVVLLAVWFTDFVDHGTASVEVETFVVGVIGTAAIFCVGFGLFRGPNLTRYPKGSPFTIGSGIAAISLVIAGYTLVGVARNVPPTPSETVAMTVLASMAFLGVVLAFRVLQTAAAQSFLISQGVPVKQILLGREHGLESIFFAHPILAALEGETVGLYRASLGGVKEFDRVPASEVAHIRREGRHGKTMRIDVGMASGGVEMRAVPVFEWEDFVAARDANAGASTINPIKR